MNAENPAGKKRFGMSRADKERLLAAMRGQVPAQAPEGRTARRQIAPELLRFDTLPGYTEIQVQKAVAREIGLDDVYYVLHDGLATNHTVIAGRDYLNFSSYDYLGLNGDSRVLKAANDAAAKYGMSASASRLTAGERPPHRELEASIASLLGTETAVCYVSGHGANMSTLGCLFGPRDVIFYDALCHNSLLLGAALSGAARYAFPNNDIAALDRLLEEHRYSYQRAIIVTEGLFGMDGCLCRLPELLELKRKHGCLIMIDEAHSMGVAGKTGAGVREHFGIKAEDVDIWMGTLSKSFCGCGGYIAGSAALIEFLKYKAPGFVYSVGMPPAVAAASNTAIRIMREEPERIARLHANGQSFLKLAREYGLDTGKSQGYSVVPIMVGDSLSAAVFAQEMRNRGILTLPVIYPGVEEGKARLRFFISAMHAPEDIRIAVSQAAEALPIAREKARSYAK
ncbi:MAG: aminotransferase class I/II-fold pyridoxal phosphate-dependent enzyme [Succinimonas sp.]|nr:aminotransferase class I/II-fold pyridoxal phosphate-dependent enzyme [Succinimonas sp.]